jgi:predicted ATP-dependent protease
MRASLCHLQRALSDLLKEANHFADASGGTAVDLPDVERAIDARIYRSARPRERLQEEIARGTIAITTSGEVVGQANGLSVAELGGVAFARPSRIVRQSRGVRCALDGSSRAHATRAEAAAANGTEVALTGT